MKRRIYNVPQNISDLIDVLRAMILGAPKFLDRTGYLPFRNLDYAFRELNEGLDFNRRKLGEERYQTLRRMSDEMRALFEADPDDTNGKQEEGLQDHKRNAGHRAAAALDREAAGLTPAATSIAPAARTKKRFISAPGAA